MSPNIPTHIPSDNRALTKLDVSNNNLGELAYPDGWHVHPRSTEDPDNYFKYIHSDGRNQDEDPGEAIVEGSAEGAAVHAGAITGMRALSKLDASNNYMFGRKDNSAIQAWADALKSSSSLLELNVAKNDMRGDDAKIFADGIRDNWALTSLDITNNAVQDDVLASIIRALKKHAIEQPRASPQLVGNELVFKDLRGFLVVTDSLKRVLPLLPTEQMCKEVATWL
jgi:hypothetical protein